jgi:hypothetical protein
MKDIRIGRGSRYFVFLLFVFLASSAVITIDAFAESEALTVLKEYFGEIRSCKNYEEYERVTRKYAYSDMIKKMDSAEVKSLPSEFKESLFSMVKNQFFDVSELVVVEEKTVGNKTSIKYSRIGHSNLKGIATLIRENNIWKIKEVSEKSSPN